MTSKRNSRTGLSRRWIAIFLSLPGLIIAAEPAASGAHVPARPIATVVASENPSYIIGPGDVLQIDVWKEPDASAPAALVRSDGIVSLPLIKEVKASGLSPLQLQQEITARLSKLVRDPDVTVIVKEIRSQKIYMIGAVRKEGPIAFGAPITLLQAVAEAGGLTEFAKRKKIYVLRKENSKEVRIRCDYSAMLRGEAANNMVLKPGDTVVVP